MFPKTRILQDEKKFKNYIQRKMQFRYIKSKSFFWMRIVPKKKNVFLSIEGFNPCSSLKCINGEECVINKYGIARCECPTDCEPIVRPVCGNNSKTYDNECELRKSGCLSKSKLETSYAGICGKTYPLPFIIRLMTSTEFYILY